MYGVMSTYMKYEGTCTILLALSRDILFDSVKLVVGLASLVPRLPLSVACSQNFLDSLRTRLGLGSVG